MTLEEKETWLRNNNWYYLEERGWCKRGAFLSGTVDADAAIELQKKIDEFNKAYDHAYSLKQPL